MQDIDHAAVRQAVADALTIFQAGRWREAVQRCWIADRDRRDQWLRHTIGDEQLAEDLADSVSRLLDVPLVACKAAARDLIHGSRQTAMAAELRQVARDCVRPVRPARVGRRA